MRPLPTTPRAWLDEIRLAYEDAADAKPFGPMVGEDITDAKLFHLAPAVCLKFRGRDLRDERDLKRATEAALSSCVKNTDRSSPMRYAMKDPKMAFALCYVASHFGLDIIGEAEALAVIEFCENQLVGPPVKRSTRSKQSTSRSRPRRR